VNKKTKKPIKSRKQEINNQKNQTVKKKLIRILKKLTGSVRFRFYKPEIEKTKPNRTHSEKTESNRFEPVFVLKNRNEMKPVGLNRFRFLKKIDLVIIFLIKIKPNKKLLSLIDQSMPG
jgi:hypothetical protein